MKYILLILMVLSLNISLAACTGQLSSGRTSDVPTLNSSVEEKANEGDEMKHEILTVKTIEDSTLIAVNERNERYIISDYTQFGIDFETGQKIGISYQKKTQNADGDYELSEVKVTKEGTVTIVPLEK